MSGIEKRCIECGTEVPTISDTPLCSKRCQIEYAHRMVRNMSDDEAWCPTCRDVFDSIKSVCYHHNKAHDFDVHRTSCCENCGRIFRPSNTDNPSKYCSERCFGIGTRAELVETECKNCESTIKHYPSSGRKFCSYGCASGGEFNNNWDGGSTDVRSTVEYRQWRQAIHDKYDACDKCGATENLHAHHIVPVSVDEELATDEDNGVLLCGACHSEEHPDMPEKLFEENEAIL